ncbi:ribonuclease H-like domain-containing protein [Mycena galopus ATCC 62051]|nr:ribonuclease H-like domain-containing protein [Mycena galopus ATCC 62051]
MPKKPTSSANAPKASANWLALRKVLPKPVRKLHDSSQEFPRKRRKIEHVSPSPSRSPSPRSSASVKARTQIADPTAGTAADLKNGESLSALRSMIFGQVEFSEVQAQPGKYLALDCEMVGVGLDGAESSLARVSLVNFHGAVILDEFVKQRERVVDYRTEWSGVREGDMVHAKPFPAIQARVAALLVDRILIGHAVHNDLRALLLSHPFAATRDTQVYSAKFGVVKTKSKAKDGKEGEGRSVKLVALRKLVAQELGASIQGGEHSSVTDARATMAVYRLHRKEWERGAPSLRPRAVSGRKTKSAEEVDEDEDKKGTVAKTANAEVFPGGGRKGVSSGLGTVVRRGRGGGAVRGGGRGGGSGGGEWWKELGSAGGAKASMRI